MKMKSSNGYFNTNTVIYNDNDGEIENRQNKTSTLECCFALPECFSPDDVNAGDFSPNDIGDLLPTAAAEQQQQQQQQEKDVDAQVEEESTGALDFPVDFSSAFGLMENDGASMDRTRTPPKPKQLASSYQLHRSRRKSSPSSVIFPSVYDTPTKQEQQHREMCRARMNSRGSYNESDLNEEILNDNNDANHTLVTWFSFQKA